MINFRRNPTTRALTSHRPDAVARIGAGTWFLGMILAGCGGSDGPLRIPLDGTVTSSDVAGELNGTIAILPAGATKGPAANGMIKAGQYVFTSENGPTPGVHRVLIDVEPPRGKMDGGDATTLQWKFEFEITVATDPPFTQDFNLERNTKP